MDSKCIEILELLKLNKIYEAIIVIDAQQRELYKLAMIVLDIQHLKLCELAVTVIDTQKRELYNLAMLLYTAVQHDPVSLKTLGLPADSLALKGYGVCNELAMSAANIAAGNGNANAQAFIGHQYSQGEYGNDGLDSEKSLLWYTLAAENNLSDAQYIVGKSYHYGEGATINPEKAAEWYLRAIAQGSADAKRHYEILSNEYHFKPYRKELRLKNPFWDIM